MVFRFVTCLSVVVLIVFSVEEVTSQKTSKLVPITEGNGVPRRVRTDGEIGVKAAQPLKQKSLVKSKIPIGDQISEPAGQVEPEDKVLLAAPTPSKISPVADSGAHIEGPVGTHIDEPAPSVRTSEAKPLVTEDNHVIDHKVSSLMSKPVAADSLPHEQTTDPPIDFEKARKDIVKNIKNQYKVLRNLTDEFRSVFAKESEQAQGIYKNLTKSLSWYFTEPDEEETRQLDKILTALYPFGGHDTDFVDSMEKMEIYCRLKDQRLDALKSWVRRKYRYNMVIQVALNMIIAKIDSKNEYYCNATAHREDFVRHMQKAKAINSNLIDTKNQFIDSANYIQNSEYQLPKVGRLCCSFWAFLRQITHNVKGTDSVDFVVDMTRHYFSSATRYVCFLYPYGSELCKDEEPAPKTVHNYNSIILEFVQTLGEIAAP